MQHKGIMSSQPITPTPGRMGFFEVTYIPAEGQRPDTFCLEAAGFQAAKVAFDGLELGTYRHVREITGKAFREWEDSFLAGKELFQ